MTLVHSVVAVLAAVALLMTLADDDGTYGIVVVLSAVAIPLLVM